MRLRLSKKSFIKYFPFVLIFLSIVTATVILVIPKEKESGIVNSIDVNKCIKDNDFHCFSDYYVAKTKNTNPVDALNDLKTLGEKNSYAKSQCHQLAHVIGHEGFAKYKTLPNAFANGNNYCWSGYYHGATESAVGSIGSEGIRKQASTICKELSDQSKYSFDHFNCVHGLGHGFMTVDNFNLFNALDSCDLLTDNWEESSCYGGVFMENVMVAVRGDGYSKYLKPDQPMYPCTDVGATYKEQCYLMQTSYALEKNSYNFSTVANLCQNLIDSDFTSTCYQSLGRDASGSTNSDIVKTKANCQSAIDQEGLKNCMLGAVRDIVSYFHSDVTAKQFCNLYETELNNICQAEVKSYYKTFNPRED